MTEDPSGPEPRLSAHEHLARSIAQLARLVAVPLRLQGLSPDTTARARLLARACHELAADLSGGPKAPGRGEVAEQCAEIRACLEQLGWTTADAAAAWRIPPRNVERLAVPRPDVPVTMRALALAALRAELRAKGR